MEEGAEALVASKGSEGEIKSEGFIVGEKEEEMEDKGMVCEGSEERLEVKELEEVVERVEIEED